MKLKGYEHMKFYTKKEFHKKYPKGAGGYTVIGAVGKGVGKGQAPATIFVNNELVEYYPYKEPGFTQEIYGYLEAGDNAYVYIAVFKSKLWKLLMVFAVLLAAISAAAYMYVTTPAGIQLDPSSGKYKAPIDLPENTDSTRIALPGYGDIYIPEGNDTVEVSLWNPETNPCYFMYKIRMKDTGEVIYESGYIAPGDAVSEVKFNKSFEQGVYEIVISIQTYDIGNYEQELNGGEMETKLIVHAK